MRARQGILRGLRKLKEDPKSSSKNTDEPQRRLLSGPRNVASSKKERHIRLGPSLAYKDHTNWLGFRCLVLGFIGVRV